MQWVTNVYWSEVGKSDINISLTTKYWFHVECGERRKTQLQFHTALFFGARGDLQSISQTFDKLSNAC